MSTAMLCGDVSNDKTVQISIHGADLDSEGWQRFMSILLQSRTARSHGPSSKPGGEHSTVTRKYPETKPKLDTVGQTE